MPEGMKFVRRGPRNYRWVHELEMLSTDTDCSAMSDDEFEQFVIAQGDA